MKAKRKLAIMLVCVLTVSLFSGMNFERAKADVFDTALTLELNGTWTDEQWITETTEEQYYKIVIPSDGKFELKVMSYMSHGWGTGFALYDQDFSEKIFGNFYVDGTEVTPSTDTTTRVLSAGTYYLEVWGSSGYDGGKTTGKYKLWATYTSYGVNDQYAISYDSPQNYSLGSQITGAITETDRGDWYKITIPDTAHYVINMKSYMSHGWGTGYALYNQDVSETILGYEYVSGTETAPTTKKSDIVLDKGIYYLEVWGSSGYDGGKTTGRYILSIEKLTQANCDHDYESMEVASTYTAKGYTLHKCSKCGRTYKDSYTAKKELNQGNIYSYGGLKPGKKRIKVSFQSIPDVSGYQIRYSTDKRLKKSVKTVKLSKSTTSKTIKKLKKKKKYYVQVRGYKKVSGTTVYGKWSQKRSAKTK